MLRPSLRAERSNPGSLRGGILDCFVARAPRNDAGRELRRNHCGSASGLSPAPAASPRHIRA
ncbi:hypothetical protein XH86_26180 [Bradyrhizobium guangdongense]|uniref:Propionyl-coenzyme A carboxylase alpha polypeptide n=1 Tax=Bradyrhizobium guangdongense TaxID=1325090 RepID=A0ABX6UKE0_9BRAD|nr:hypothetical protein X265_26155 [Bradyrhizobium guangdongense]QOZ61835.1 hypothetical protein XH86_26180 [Bradyrhizobium guangdongense]